MMSTCKALSPLFRARTGLNSLAGPAQDDSDRSVVLARCVLGTVPVEADRSAHFTFPAKKEFFSQALDEKGLAVQSMRSAAYLTVFIEFTDFVSVFFT